MKKLIVCSMLCAAALGFLCGCLKQPFYRQRRLMMGTFVEVASPDKAAIEIVFKEIQRIEDLLSKYKEESEVSRLNKSGKLKVSPETFFIIKKCVEFSRASEGAFDISVAPLVDLWGFTDGAYRIPAPKEINRVLKLVGYDKIIFQNKNNMIKFKIPGMKIDLGAIAKGYALDCAVSQLKRNNITSCMINAGGQVYCLGSKSGRPWKVAIQDARGENFKGRLFLEDACAATSGDYRQYFLKGKKRYCHILNPKTGYPADSGIASVTVVAPSALTADALSTAIFVLGEIKGQELAGRFKGVKLIISNQSGY